MYHIKCLTEPAPLTFAGWDGFDLEYAIALEVEVARENCGIIEDG